MTKDSFVRYFSAKVRGGCRKAGVNFAGHYTVVEMSCGTECALAAIIDRINGKSVPIPFDTLEGHWGLEYYRGNRMLIVNSELLKPFPGYVLISSRKPAIYEMKDDELRFVE